MDSVTILVVAVIGGTLALMAMLGWLLHRSQRRSGEAFDRYAAGRQLQFAPGSTRDSFVAIGAANGVPYTLQTVLFLTSGGSSADTSSHAVHLRASAAAPRGLSDGQVYNRRCHWAADDLIGYSECRTGDTGFDRMFTVRAPLGMTPAWLTPDVRAQLTDMRTRNAMRLHQLVVGAGEVSVSFTSVVTDPVLLDGAVGLVTETVPRAPAPADDPVAD